MPRAFFRLERHWSHGGIAPWLAFVSSLVIATANAVTPVKDVTGFSIIRGKFLNQEGPDDLRLDPIFGFSLMANVDLSNLNLVQTAKLRLPEGSSVGLEDYSDTWSLLDSYPTLAELNEAYVWGDYFVSFTTRHEGSFTCMLEFPETAIPATPYLVNYGVTQSVDPGHPLTLHWDFKETPAPGDFMQVYVTLGHGEIFSTPNAGEPGALTLADRSVTIPANTLVPGFVHSLNLELTRTTSTNTACYPGVEGFGAVFNSTSVSLFVLTPPTLRFLARDADGRADLEVVADPDGAVVLQGSPDLKIWSNLATNTAATGTNVFKVQPSTEPWRFFRAFQP